MSGQGFPDPPKTLERVFVKRGLDGQDDNIDLLESYFREMQKTTVEPAYGPEDFLSFAGCVHYFGVVMIETQPDVPSESNHDDETDEDAEGEPEEDTQPVSRATSPPSSLGDSISDFGSPHIATNSPMESGLAEPVVSTSYMSPPTRSQQEDILKWKAAFEVDLEEAGEELFIPPEEDPDAPFFPRAREVVETLPDFLISDPSRLSSSSRVLYESDEFINWPDEERLHIDPPTQPVIQQGPSKFYEVVDTPFRSRVDPNLGREYLEPAQYDSPAPVLKKTTDPKTEALIYDAAIHFRDQLRSNRVRAHEAKKLRKALQHSAPPIQSAEPKIIAIGLIYLSTSQNFMDPLHMGEYSMGLYIAPAYRQKQSLVSAVNEVTAVAFNDHECHRLQSIVVDNDDKLPTLELLSSAGFRNEGVRRRAFYSNSAVEWKDVTYFAMLATEWVFDNNNKKPQTHIRPKSLWDDLLTRHQRECDDLVRLEEKQRRRLKRAASMETIREPPSPTRRIGTAATSVESIPTYSQRALQKKRRVDSEGPEESIYSGASSTSEYLSVPCQSGIAVQQKGPIVSTSIITFPHAPEVIHSPDACFSTRSPLPRELSNSPSSTASSFSDISNTSDWEMVDDES